MNIPTPTTTRKKYDLLSKQGGSIEEMEPLEKVILKFLPLSTWKFLTFTRTMKKIMLLYLTQEETPEMKAMVAKFIDRYAEPHRRQELATLMRRAIGQAKEETGGIF